MYEIYHTRNIFGIMRILISNDDGYQARGIHVLAKVMEPFGSLTVVAPKYHQSAMGMAVSMGFKKLAFKELPHESPGDWSYLDATPASCVKFALEYKYEDRNPDVVVTGINHGTNASMAANYSATVGCAEEGALNGVKAIAVSVCDFSPNADFSGVEKYFPDIFRFLMENWPEDDFGLLYNINFPACPADDIRGVKITRQGRGHWVREFRPWDEMVLSRYGVTAGQNWEIMDRPLESGETGYMMVGDFVDDEEETGDADHRLNMEGWITITPNKVDRTHYGEYQRLNSLLEEK